MALTTPLDKYSLDSWSFLKAYASHHDEWIDLARILRRAVILHSGIQPTPGDLVELLEDALRSSRLYQKICSRKQHLRPEYYAIYAEKLARYIIDQDWPAISAP